uniref:PIPK domain-containing protein n=1 Tax=Macrostomum lignano TaxID=282301 RepID=A0A1I8FUH0_9PLAT
TIEASRQPTFVVFRRKWCSNQFADVVDPREDCRMRPGCLPPRLLQLRPRCPQECCRELLKGGLLLKLGCSARMEISLVEGPHEMDIHVKKSRKVKGVRQKLKLFRANEPLKSVIMWGISYSFEQLNHVNKRTMLLPDDFKSYLKVKVDNHLFNKDNMPSRFQFKEYCPLVFADLRAKFGVADSADLLSSWTNAHSRTGTARSPGLMLASCAPQKSAIRAPPDHLRGGGTAATLLPAQYLAIVHRATVEDTDYYLLMMR